MRAKVFILTGATAVGKSDLAVRLAESFCAEVIGADSMQVYRGFDIGTGKITQTEMRGITHHMIDVADPSEDYSVEKYVQSASEIIENLHAQNKRILVVGGTGLYIQALVNGFNFAHAPQSDEIRTHYQELARREGNKALYEKLMACDPESCEKISPNDTKRIIRALEIYELTGQPKSERVAKTMPQNLDAYTVVLQTAREQLYQRINKRVDDMIANGLEQEVRKLTPYSACRSMQAIGYKEFLQHFQGALGLDETIALIKQRSRNYAKRQMTYFRWFDVKKEFYDITPFGQEGIEQAYQQLCEKYHQFLQENK